MLQLTRKRASKSNTDYTLEGTALQYVDRNQYLGAIFQEEFRWNIHVIRICTLLRQSLFSRPKTLNVQLSKDLEYDS